MPASSVAAGEISDGPESDPPAEEDAEMAAVLATTEDRSDAKAEGEVAWSYEAIGADLTA